MEAALCRMGFSGLFNGFMRCAVSGHCFVSYDLHNALDLSPLRLYPQKILLALPARSGIKLPDVHEPGVAAISCMTTMLTECCAAVPARATSLPSIPSFLLVDDHPIVLQGMRTVLGAAFPSATVAQARTAHEALEAVWKRPWHLVLLDINLNEVKDLELLKQIKKSRPTMPVLAMSGYSEKEYAVRVFRSGAAGYLMKDTDIAEVLEAINRALAGERYISKSVAALLAAEVDQGTRETGHQSLSDRELQVLKLVAKGRTSKEIGDHLSLSIKTIQTYRSRIQNKIGLTRASDLTRYVLQNGLDG